MSRKIIDKVEYLKTQAALEKCLNKTPKLELVPGVHNVNLIPEGLNIHYISLSTVCSLRYTHAQIS